MKRISLPIGAPLLFLALGAMGGCAEEEPDACMPLVTIEATPPALASGDMLRLTVDVRDMELVVPGDEADADLGKNCAGHYKVHLDSVEKDPVLESIEEEVVFPIMADMGEHELIVRLYGPDDVPLIPDMRDTVTLTFQ